MSKPTILSRMFGIAVFAMMFGAAPVHAQTATDASGQTKENKAGSMSPGGQNETSSVKPRTDASGSSAGVAKSASGSPDNQTMDATGKTRANRAGEMSPAGQNETSSVKPKTSGSSDATSSSASGSASGATGSSSSAASGSVSKADQKMMKDLAQANMAEIEAGKMAQEKSSNEEVKSFAQKMVDDHTKASDQLKELAQAKGVTLPTAPDAKHKAEMKKLSALSGDKFDKMYMSRGGVRDHSQTLALLNRIEKNAKDSDLKSLASTLKPTVSEHMKMAKEAHGSKSTATGASGTKSTSKSGAGKAEKSSGASSSSSSKSGPDNQTMDATGKTRANRAGEMSTAGQNETSSVKPTGESPSTSPGTSSK